jgi:hypothetical protein
MGKVLKDMLQDCLGAFPFNILYCIMALGTVSLGNWTDCYGVHRVDLLCSNRLGFQFRICRMGLAVGKVTVVIRKATGRCVGSIVGVTGCSICGFLIEVTFQAGASALPPSTPVTPGIMGVWVDGDPAAGPTRSAFALALNDVTRLGGCY